VTFSRFAGCGDQEFSDIKELGNSTTKRKKKRGLTSFLEGEPMVQTARSKKIQKLRRSKKANRRDKMHRDQPMRG